MDLPLLARIATCVCIATLGMVAIDRVFLRRGPGCVRALAWSGSSQEFQLHLAGEAAPVAASLARGSFRLGSFYLLLWLRTAHRTHAVFIDGTRQEAACFRSLCRRLQWPPRVPDTIPPRI